MESFEKDRVAVKTNKPTKNLTPGQQKALALTQAQGVKPVKNISELYQNIESDAVDELQDIIKKFRQQPAKPQTIF